MSSTKLSSGKLEEIEKTAAGWGKLLAHEAFPEGPGLDVSLVEMEEIVMVATRAIVRGAVETMTDDQANNLNEELPCPGCGKLCPVKRKGRPIAVRGGTAELNEAVAHCSTCRRDFFPSA
jgi:hypothetical protein